MNGRYRIGLDSEDGNTIGHTDGQDGQTDRLR